MKITIKILFLLISLPVYSQTFEVDTLFWNGSIESRINIVILGDGYLESELSKFDEHSRKFADYFFTDEPFANYRNYFNVFAIRVPSNVSGAALNPSNLIDNYYGSTFGSGGIDRLLVPTKYSRITGVLSSNFPSYDQVIMLVNSTKYGGSGGWVATSSVHQAAGEIVLHEVGHSFAALADEYYAGDQYARERVNMTKETNPDLVVWKNWYGDYDIGIYQHCCGGNSAQWYKPHQGCKMQGLGNDFCSVCTEALIAKIHKITSPVDSFTPNNDVLEPEFLPILFNLNLVKPQKNTLKIDWTVNSAQFASNTESMILDESDLSDGNNTIIAYIRDTTKSIRINNYDIINIYSVKWSIEKKPSGVKDIHGEHSNLSIAIYPNPATELIHLKFDDLLSHNISISLYNISGQKVKEIKRGEIQSQEYSFDISDLPSSSYILKISDNGYPIATKKIVKNN